MGEPGTIARLQRPRSRARGRAASLALVCVAAISGAAAAEDDDGVLRITGMTFVGSRGESAELVLHSERAIFHPDRDVAELEVVDVLWTDAAADEHFTMTCDRAELDVETNDFLAEGDVRGVTAEGQRYAASVVSYDHEAGLLQSDRRVTLVDDTGRFEGDGFRYLVREGTFRLLGNVRVVQAP